MNFWKLAASTLCEGMFDDTIILQISLENSYALQMNCCVIPQTAITVCFPWWILCLRSFCV
jgi:hypothetical protein